MRSHWKLRPARSHTKTASSNASAGQAQPEQQTRECNRQGWLDAFYFNFLSNVTIALWNENIVLYVFVKKRAAFVCFCQKESGPRVVKSGHGPDRPLARARARPPMRAVPRCRTRVSSRRSSGYQEPQWVIRGLSALHKQPRPPLRCDKRQGHRETKRAPSGKWNGRRVENDGNFGAQ